jgi:uncharacterized membrane protein
MDSQIIVLGYEGQLSAEAMLKDFTKMQEEGVIELDDAVVASRASGNTVEIKQLRSDTAKFAARGGGVGVLAGLLLGGPILGLAAGATVGAIAARLKDHGIDDGFIKSVTDGLGPKTSALFLMGRAADPDVFLERLRPLKANVLSTTLSDEQATRIREALSEEDLS